MYRLLFLSIYLLLVACAEPSAYRSINLDPERQYGYSEIQLSENVFQIRFKGNSVTSSERAEDFSLLRGAELALEHGFKYFALMDSESKKDTYKVRTPLRVYVYGHTYPGYYYQDYGYGHFPPYYGYNRVGSFTVTGGEEYNVSKPKAMKIIVCFKSKPKKNPGVLDAKFIADSIRVKYGM